MKAWTSVALGGLVVASAMSCGTTTSIPPDIQNLNRPVDVAFACYGQMRLLGPNGAPDPEDELVFQPQPAQSCAIRARMMPRPPMEGMPSPDLPNVPPGQEDMDGQPLLKNSMRWLGFAVQSASGTVAVFEAEIKPPNSPLDPGKIDPDVITVLDGDPLTPGKNALSVGSQPVSIAADASGCFMATANAGSCDLSVIDVERVYRTTTDPQVRRQAITTPSGVPVLARPAAMITAPLDREIGVACPQDAVGTVYIAYPECHAVAVVDLATGMVQSSILFDAAGNASLGTAELSCPAECGMRMPSTDAGRPVSIEITRDDVAGTRRLAIGLDNRPVITVVDLDVATMPTASIEQYELDGDVGVIDVALTDVISMTGERGWEDDILPTRDAQFVYAVATDGSIRVVDTLDRDHECETNVDPRYLRGITTPDTFSCFPVNQVGTPPRRAFARGPGIELVGEDVPLSVAVAKARWERESEVGVTITPGPGETVGWFAMATSSLGSIYTINIDDDNYPDFFRAAAPLENDLALGLPHQLRDNNIVRGGQEDDALLDHDDNTNTPSELHCDFRGPVDTAAGVVGGPRAEQLPTRFIDDRAVSLDKGYEVPYIRQLHCDGYDAARALPEVMYATPRDIRAKVFPDLRALNTSENWSFQYEGLLSRDDGVLIQVDGPQVRHGTVEVGGGNLRLRDGSKPYCGAGVEPYDNVQLVGCDPAQGNNHCGLGEVCFVHPDSTVIAGICLPEGQADTIGALCRDYAVSVRRYAVQQVSSGELLLSERRRVLRTSPVDGCVSDQQCTELALYDAETRLDGHPFEIAAGRAAGDIPAEPEFSYACAPDPTREGGFNRCQMTCVEEDDCAAGTICSGGFCIEGTLPPRECLAGLQRYTLAATESMVVIGKLSGYIHPWIEGPGGACVRDPEASPLQIGRFKLSAPACPTGDDVSAVTPNPCSVRLDHTELAPAYTDDECTLDDEPERMVTRQVDAIRFRNQAFTLNITDPTYPGDRRCRNDREGGRVGIPVAYPGYAFAFTVIGGFRPLRSAVPTVLPSRIVKAPDGVMWIVDEGDVVGNDFNDVNIQGQIVRVNPEVPAAGMVVR